MLTPEEAVARSADREQEAEDAAAEAAATESGGTGAGGTGEPGSADEGADPAKASHRAPTTDDVRERYTFQGFPIAVENKAGTTRFWKDEDDNTVGQTKMLHDYGFIESHVGNDGEELDSATWARSRTPRTPTSSTSEGPPTS